MKQIDDMARIRVDAREIRAFIGVASIARPSEIVGIVDATVLPGDDMLDMERQSLNESR
jgi:hypothetical protein